jgi:hypothetical protein
MHMYFHSQVRGIMFALRVTHVDVVFGMTLVYLAHMRLRL